MASGVAPVKPDYIRKAGVKVVVEAVLGSAAAPAHAAADAAAQLDAGGNHQPQTAKKRSRRQQQKVSVGLSCPDIITHDGGAA
jgi:hypothetical protein